MTVIPPSVFNDNDVVLRVWFNDGVIGEQQLSPDQALTSVPYAMAAATSPPIGTVMPFMGDPVLLSGTPWVLSNGDPFPADADPALIATLGPNTPIFGGKVPRGLSGGQAIGDIGGSDSITTSNHTHGLPSTTGQISPSTCGPLVNFAVVDNFGPPQGTCTTGHFSVANGGGTEGAHVHNIGGSTGSAGAQTISSVPSHVVVHYIN